MKHKHYDCIVAFAEGKRLEFAYPEGDGVYSEPNNYEITNPVTWPSLIWRVKKEPVIEVKYFERVTYRDGSFYKVFYKEFTPDLEKWDLKITYQDGKAIKAEVSE